MQISESRSIEDAKRIVAQLSFGARITPWEQAIHPSGNTLISPLVITPCVSVFRQGSDLFQR